MTALKLDIYALGLEKFAITFFRIIDTEPAENLHRYLSSDVRFRMANNNVILGVESLITAFRNVKSQVQSVEHKILGIWRGEWANGAVVSVEAEVTYTYEGGAIIRLPATSTLRLNANGLIEDYRIFMDPSSTLIAA